MPERRKIKGPNLKSSPKRDREVDSPEFHRVLDPKDEISQHKDKFSDDRSVAPEYNDGTTRPMFQKKLKRVAVNLGDTAQLVCVVSGSPSPKVLWLKNNRPLKESDGCRVVVDGDTNILIFASVTQEDLGTYTARAMNVNGSVMSSTELTLRQGRSTSSIRQPPESPMDLDFNTPAYFFQMSSCHVEEGRLARFDCRVVAYPRPDIVWMRDGKVVESGERYKLLNFNNEIYSLLVQNVEIPDTGRYTCWARNKFGEAMTEAFLNVIALKDRKEDEDIAPSFLTKFYDQKVTEGVPAEFKCLIEGRPEPAVTWLLNEIELKESPGVKMKHQDGMVSLEFKASKREQVGEYTCQLNNPLGEAKCSATLTVLEDKLKGPILPKFLKRFDHVSAREGDEARFECIVVGEPSPTITWLFDHKPIPDNKRFVITREGDIHALIIKGVRFEDDGKITCKAVNNEGEVYCSANMYVRESKKSMETPEKMSMGTSPAGTKPDAFDAKHGYVPTFTKRLNDLSTPEGSRASFECKVMGIPDPDVTWMKDGRIISPGGRYIMKRENGLCTLIIDNVNAGDGGVFTCIASNAAGKSSSLAQLKVGDDKPVHVERPHDDDKYTPTKRPSRDFTKSDSIPSIPYDKPSLLDSRGDSVKLSWTPAYTTNLPPEAKRVSYIVESRERPGFEWTKIATSVPGNTYLARNLRPDREYEFRVRAQNQYGISDPTKPGTLPKREADIQKLVVDLPELRAPPKMPVSRPLITEMGKETVRLAWRPVESIQPRPHPPVSYRLEAKSLPGTEWSPITSRIQDTTHYMSELLPDRDYMFRVRAENEFGVSEPTDPLWLPRGRRFPDVPIERPEIVELEPHRTRLTWQRVDIPGFSPDESPLLYMLEMEEPPSRDWRTIAYDLDDTEYIIDGLKPGSDYRFRVRAKTPAGVISEPSPAVSLYTTLAKTRAPVDHLEVERYDPDAQSLQLSWQRVDIPPFDMKDEPLMYMLEYRVPHLSDWRPLVSGIPTTRYRVTELVPDQDYQFQVRALSPYGISQPSPVLPVSYRQISTAPIRPLYTGLEISDVEPEGLRLSWRPPTLDTSQPIRYRVERQEPPHMDWTPLTTGLTDTSYRVTNLQPTKDYKFRVVPQVGGHYYEPSAPVALSTVPVRPRLHLQEPKLRELGPDSVQVSWPPADFPIYQRQKTPLYYSLEMLDSPNTPWVPVSGRIPDTSYTVTGLRPDRDYKFRVRAVTDFVSSEPSLPVTFYRRPAPTFPKHEPVMKDVSANAVLLSWQPATLPSSGQFPPVSYRVEAQTPPGVSTWSPLLSNHPTCSVRLSDLRPDLDYLIRVRAQFKDILTEPTLPCYIPRRAVPPRLPNDEPYPVEIAPTAVKLQWRSADLPVHISDYSPVTYHVEVQEQPGKSWVTVARGIPHTDFRITNLNAEKEYQFRIRGENDYGLSEPTRPVQIKQRAVAPRLPSESPLVFDVGPGSAKMSWRPADIPSYFSDLTPIYYTIYVQEPPFKTWRPLVRKIPHTMYHVTGLLPDKDYNFRVQAENEFGASRPTEHARLPRKSSYKAPVYAPEIDDFEDDETSVKLRWKPRAVAPFDRGSMRFRVESWEPMARTWKSLATGLSEPSYTLSGLKSGVDNLLRIRAESDQIGLSKPSVPISVSRDYRFYRTPLLDRRSDMPRIPVYRPQLHEVEPDSVKLSWQPTRLPSIFYRRPVRYGVEMRELPGQSWRSIASELMDTTYRVSSLRPRSEYEFRVRALTDDGPSEPSRPVPLYRRPVIPNVRLESPEVYDVDDDGISLRWSRVDVPSFSRDEEPMTYMIESQRLPDFEWRPLARGIYGTSHRITGLRQYQDYVFRVRGEYPSGYTAPSPSVPVYRRPSESDFLTNQRPSKYSLQSSVPKPKQGLSRSPKPTNEPLPTQSLRASLPRPVSSFHESPRRPLSLKKSPLSDSSDVSNVESLPKPQTSKPAPRYKRRFSVVNDIVSFFEVSKDNKSDFSSDDIDPPRFTTFIKDGLPIHDADEIVPERHDRRRSLGFTKPPLRRSMSVDMTPKTRTILGIDINEKIKSYQDVLRLPKKIIGKVRERSLSLAPIKDTMSLFERSKIIDDDIIGSRFIEDTDTKDEYGGTFVYSIMDKTIPSYCVLEDMELPSTQIGKDLGDSSPGYLHMSKFSVLVDIPGTSCALPTKPRSVSPLKRFSVVEPDEYPFTSVRSRSPSLMAILNKYLPGRTSSPYMFSSRESSVDSVTSQCSAPELGSFGVRRSRSPTRSFKFLKVPAGQNRYSSPSSRSPSLSGSIDGRSPMRASPMRPRYISPGKEKSSMSFSLGVRSQSLRTDIRKAPSPIKEVKEPLHRATSYTVPYRIPVPEFTSFQAKPEIADEHSKLSHSSVQKTEKYSSKHQSPKDESKYDSQRYSPKYDSQKYSQKYDSKYDSQKYSQKYESQKYSSRYESPSTPSYPARSASMGSLYKPVSGYSGLNTGKLTSRYESPSAQSRYSTEKTSTRYESPFTKTSYQPRSYSKDQDSYQSRSLSRDQTSYQPRSMSSSQDYYKPRSYSSTGLSHKPSSLFKSLSKDMSYKTARSDLKGFSDRPKPSSHYSSSSSGYKSRNSYEKHRMPKFSAISTNKYSKIVASLWPLRRSRSLPSKLSKYYGGKSSHSLSTYSRPQSKTTGGRYSSHDSYRGVSSGRYDAGSRFAMPQQYSPYSRYSSESRTATTGYGYSRPRSSSPTSSSVRQMFSSLRSSLDQTRSTSRYQPTRMTDRSPSVRGYGIKSNGSDRSKVTKVIHIPSSSRDRNASEPEVKKYAPTTYAPTSSRVARSVTQYSSQPRQAGSVSQYSFQTRLTGYQSYKPQSTVSSQSKTQTQSTVARKPTKEKQTSPRRSLSKTKSRKDKPDWARSKSRSPKRAGKEIKEYRKTKPMSKIHLAQKRF